MAPFSLLFNKNAPGRKLKRRLLMVLSLAVVIAGIAYINNESKSSSGSAAKTATTIAPNLNLRVGAWLPYWDDGTGVASFKKVSSSLTEIHPFAYQANSVTNITLLGNATHNAGVLSAIHKTKSQLIPTFTETMNTADFTALLKDPVATQQHADAVCTLAVNNKYDGVDIDYENFVLNLSLADAPATAPLFTNLMQKIGNCLHNHNKLLEITLLPRTGDPNYAYFEDHLSNAVFDYAALGRIADYIQPMAYDFSYPGSTPASTDPLAWVKAVVKYATAQVPAHKVQLALPLYGYDWGSGHGKSVTAGAAARLAASYNVTPTRDALSQSLIFTYTDSGGTNHTVWYDDAQATAMRVAAAQQAGLAGVMFWTIGDEVPGSWAQLTKTS